MGECVQREGGMTWGLAISDAALGDKLRSARSAVGKTQEEAAAALGVARTTIVAIENGTRKIRSDELLRYADFLGENVNTLVHSTRSVDFTAQFRRKPATKDALRDRLAKQSQEAEKLLQRLTASYLSVEDLLGRPLRYDYPPEVKLMRGSAITQADDVALDLRGRLGLALRPLEDLVRVAETELTIRVFERPLPSPIAGAFAYSDEAGACVILNLLHPRPRRAWTLAHEIGHFLTARHVGDVVLLAEDGRSSERERFSDAFAPAFLLPAAAIRRRFEDVCESEGKFSTRSLVYLARTFHVSVEAMARRLERLELLPKGTFESLKQRGFSVQQVEGSDPQRRALELPAPERFNMLTAEAYARGLLSEGQCTTALALDRLKVRELLDVLGGEGSLSASHA
jgi:Zn-dependent peptidase ImmA (M78 family)/DNA-binding XRE family transcriptional regulator